MTWLRVFYKALKVRTHLKIDEKERIVDTKSFQSREKILGERVLMMKLKDKKESIIDLRKVSSANRMNINTKFFKEKLLITLDGLSKEFQYDSLYDAKSDLNKINEYIKNNEK